MKKIKIIGILFIFVLLIFGGNMKVNAVETSVKLESIKVTSPKTGTYKTGEKITIVATYTGEIAGKGEIQIKFGEKGQDRTIKGNISGNLITYEYVIRDDDCGKMTLSSIRYTEVTDKEGNKINNDASIILTGNEITVNPIEWTDTSKMKISIDSNYYLKVTGIEQKTNNQYFGFITNNTVEPKIVLDKNNWVTNYNFISIKSMNIESYLEKNGDLYLWICEQQKSYETRKNEQKFIVRAKKIERPKFALGSKIYVSAMDDDTYVGINCPHMKENKRNAKLKIGNITDKSILNSIKNKEEGSLEKLLSYAQKANSLYEGTIEVEKHGNGNIANNINLVDKGYYYVYTVIDDEGGKYYPIEDIAIVQAAVYNTGKKAFLTEIKWENDEEEIKKPTQEDKKDQPQEDNTQAKGELPKTGVIYLEILGVMLLVAGAITFAYKYNKYKKI